ncbi:hypothetical protein ITP53_42120 [Nonomuraea sp. K274]|uniref:Uncharacterized protein n=1 Tax=Nonomuraea cypriaca TaxID=1187855 RepID=A0A931ANK4_9ACTN|nr:hypothetical protein [Nonomuraea cypriaca]MBF8192167.1 hypothetical protein [Nonomuraea cypriaca]
MNWASMRVGRRAVVIGAVHSHARTRAHAPALIGRAGVVVAVLRGGSVALLQLDDAPHDLPGGTRRWPFHWGDLALDKPDEVTADPVPAYVAGFEKTAVGIVQHAVRPGEGVALCSSSAGPSPVCGWSLAFSANISRACPKCVALASGS